MGEIFLTLKFPDQVIKVLDKCVSVQVFSTSTRCVPDLARIRIDQKRSTQPTSTLQVKLRNNCSFSQYNSSYSDS